MKIVEWLVRIIFWLQAFAGPVILFGLIAFLIYNGTENTTVAIILLSIGVISGILLAEFIRRKYGLESFFARIYGPNELDKKD
jgi:hypothetical protein